MGRVVLQMMASLDGMISGPGGELDWQPDDEKLEQAHLASLEQASLVIVGAGVVPDMPDFWKAAEHDKSAPVHLRDIGRAINAVPKIVYSHQEMSVDWPHTTVHVVNDDAAFVEDVNRLKQRTDGTIIVYGGVRLARSFVQQNLLDEIHLDICPVILGEGQPLFTDLAHRINLRLLHSISYSSGATSVHYEVM